MGEYFYKERFRFPMKQYDIIITKTTVNLCAVKIDLCKRNRNLRAPGYMTKLPVCSLERNIRRSKTLSNTMIIHYDWEFTPRHLILVQYPYKPNVDCDSENDETTNNIWRITWPVLPARRYSRQIWWI